MKTFLSVIFLSIMIACGGGGSSTETTTPQKHFVTNATFKGIFKQNIASTNSLVKNQTTQTSNMTTPRSDACGAVLLDDGRVLIAGGFSPDNSFPNQGTLPVTNTAEVYDPSTSTFSAVGSMETPRYEDNPVKLPSGNVVFFGGTQDQTAIEIFDPTTNLFTKVGDLTEGCSHYAIAKYINGKILLFGYGACGGYVNPATFFPEVVDTSDWSSKVISNDTSFNIVGCQAEVYQNKVLIFGGVYWYDSQGGVINNIYQYDSSDDSITLIHHLINDRAFFGISETTDGKILLSGGTDNSANLFPSDIEEYDPISNTSSIVGSIAYREALIQSFTLQNGQIVSIGGIDNTDNRYASNRQVIYDPISQSSGLTGNMIIPRQDFSAVQLPNGLILIAGGISQVNTENWMTEAELFDPQLNLSIEAPTNTMQVGTSMDLIVVGTNYTLSCNIGSITNSTYTAPVNISSDSIVATITATSNTDGSVANYYITITQ